MTKLRVQWLLLLLATLPALLPAWMIARLAVAFPYWDEWDPGIASLYIKAHQHQLHFYDLAAFHNEHRILIPRIIFLVVNSLTHWNTTVLMYLSWLIVCVTSVMVLLLIIRTVDQGVCTSRSLLLWGLANVLIFTPAQWENWLWGMGVQNVLPMFWISIGAVLLCKRKAEWWRIIAAATIAMLASFSSANGLLAWPILGAMIAWADSIHALKLRKWKIFIFAAFGMAAVLLYFHGFESRTVTAPPSIATGIVNFIKYGCLFLGGISNDGMPISPFGSSYVVAIILLLFLAGAVMYLAVSGMGGMEPEVRWRIGFWLCMAAFPVASAILVAKGRSGSGIDGALSPRYITFALYLPVSLIAIYAIILPDLHRRGLDRMRLMIRWVGGGVIAGMLVAHVAQIRWNIQYSAEWQFARRQGVAAMLFSRFFPQNPWLERAVFPRPAEIMGLIEPLESIGMLHPRLTSPAAKPLIQPLAPGSASAGRIDQVYQKSNTTIAVEGVAILPYRRTVPDGVVLTCEADGGEPMMFSYVAGEYEHLDGRWNTSFDISALPHNAKSIRIRAFAVDAEQRRLVPLDGVWNLNR